MWRFLQNIPRALKNYHGPRASAGVYVDSDDKDSETAAKQEKELHTCAAQAPRQKTCCVFRSDGKPNGRTLLWRLISPKKEGRSHTFDDQKDDYRTNHEDWWNACHRDIQAFLQGSNTRMLEAFALGSSYLWGQNKRNKKSNFLFRVLLPVSEKDELVKKNRGEDVVQSVDVPRGPSQTLLAIKDAAGSAHDGAVNESKSQTLDAALKEFEHNCCEYTAQNESLLALVAADDGDMSEAVKHFRKSCAAGNKTACFNLGLCYEMGAGVTKDLDKAKHYYEVAAAKGHRQAMYNLSLLYLDEIVVGDWGRYRKKGIEFMERAAKAGLPKAQTYMGVFFMEEIGDAKMAASYFKAAATQNDSEAQYFLALCHEHGLGMDVNECRAAHLYSLAAGLAHDGAMYNLGRFNEEGLGGIPVDQSTAVELYFKAAQLGNEEAKSRLDELKSAKVKEDERRSVKDEVQSPSMDTPVTHSNKSIHPSFSSPDLKPMDCSLYQRLRGLLETSEIQQTLFDPGGVTRVCFSIGGGDEMIGRRCYSGEQGAEEDLSTSFENMYEKISYHCGSNLNSNNAIQKSNTTPDLYSMVACNI